MSSSVNGNGDDLTPRQQDFCLFYAETGSGTQSYKRAFGNEQMKDSTAAAAASRLLKKVKVLQKIRDIREEAAKPKIKGISEIQAFLSDVIGNTEISVSIRIQASRLLLQSQGGLKATATAVAEINVNDSDYTVVRLPPLADENGLWNGSPDPPPEDQWIEIL